jgi:transcriptional regulator with XRE-family HTH domain
MFVELTLDWSCVVARTTVRKTKPKQGGFGPRLARLRQARALTQEELGGMVGLSNRMVAYYERDEAQPPGEVLTDLARALKVSTDELLGLAPIKNGTSPKTARLLKRLQKVSELTPADQRAVLKMVDALVAVRSGA